MLAEHVDVLDRAGACELDALDVDVLKLAGIDDLEGDEFVAGGEEVDRLGLGVEDLAGGRGLLIAGHLVRRAYDPDVSSPPLPASQQQHNQQPRP
jgi:hypothetical protein